MNSKMLLLSIGMTLWSASHAFELITAEEAAQNARPPEGYTLRRAAPTEPPRIVVDQPKNRDLKNPIETSSFVSFPKPEPRPIQTA